MISVKSKIDIVNKYREPIKFTGKDRRVHLEPILFCRAGDSLKPIGEYRSGYTDILVCENKEGERISIKVDKLEITE
jgi:hypothetical protein